LDSTQPDRDKVNYGGLFLHILHPFESTAILESKNCCKLLLSVKEKAFSANDHYLIHQYLAFHYGDVYTETLILQKESSSVMFNGCLYGGYFSRQRNSSLVIAHTKTISGDVQEQPFFVIGFVECTVVFKQSRLPQTCVNNIILAKVIPLQNHPQKCLYPKPIEVWNKLEDDLMYNPSLHKPR